MNYTYRAYGLVLKLPFACENLPPAPAGAQPDVVVAEGKTPVSLDSPLISEPIWQAEAQRFLWKGGPRSGRFLVEGGRLVTLERFPLSEEQLIAFHFLDAVLAAVLSQRGMLVMHANAAKTPRGAIAISGESGTGKSTTLAALLQCESKMLTDDITALQLASDGRVEVLPGIPQLHLTEQAAEALNQDISNLRRFRWRRMKAAVPAFTHMAQEPAILRSLYILHKQAGGSLRFQRMDGAEKFTAVQECIYGPLLPETISQQFPLMAAVVAQVEVIRIYRPSDQWSLDGITAEILNG